MKGFTTGMACRTPPPLARVGEGLSNHAGAQLALKFSGARERRGRRPPSIPRMKGGITPLQDPPECHVVEQGCNEKRATFSVFASTIGANGACFRPSLRLEWLPQVQGFKMTSKLVYRVSGDNSKPSTNGAYCGFHTL